MQYFKACILFVTEHFHKENVVGVSTEQIPDKGLSQPDLEGNGI